jgi:HD superfamily phosphohydrolase
MAITALLDSLIESSGFERLKSIRFLGGIDYLLVPTPNGARHRYTRYQHSVGVARLALRYAEQRQLSQKQIDVLTSAALLHDIGHSPLSHSLEPVFVKYFGINHHHATVQVIKGDVQKLRSVYDTLKTFQVDVEAVLAVLSGDDDCFEGFFSGPINFDTIEGIMRSRNYAARGTWSLVSPEAILDAAVRRGSVSDQNKVDAFWECKDQVYKHVINSPLGVLADKVCQTLMEQHIANFEQQDYFSTERNAFAKIPGLHRLLKSSDFPRSAMKLIHGPVPFYERRFTVDDGGDFYSRQDHIRYRQTKKLRELPLLAATEVGEDLYAWKSFDGRLQPSKGLF